MMSQFLLPHVINLSENGFTVEIACSDVGGRMDTVREKLNGYAQKIHVVHLVRSPASLTNRKGYREMKQVIDSGHYDIIWTNEPVMGVVTRLAARDARKKGTKVLYMVHGFHFFKGAPAVNWMIYYPIEKLMASKADVICTINREDYARAQKMRVQRVEYIHGIGINTSRFTEKGPQGNIRKELGLAPDDFLILSVGELNKNKNQKTMLRAIAQLHDPDIHYLLCGRGDQLEHLREQANALGMGNHVHFLGYRTDVADICRCADVFGMPSYREGLPVAALEAMYCGLPLVTSNIRGLVDIMEAGVTGELYDPDDAAGFSAGIAKLKASRELREQMGSRNKQVVQPYCIEETKKEVLKLIASLR